MFLQVACAVEAGRIETGHTAPPQHFLKGWRAINAHSHAEPGDLQRLFARVSWRMRNGWASDVPFVEKLSVISPVCSTLLDDGGEDGTRPLIQGHDGWGGCENVEPDIECVVFAAKAHTALSTPAVFYMLCLMPATWQVHQHVLPHRLLPPAAGLVGRRASDCCRSPVHP